MKTRKGCNIRGHAAGFTLLEVMVVVAIIGTLLAIALPPATQWRASLNAAQTARAMVNMLSEARSKALTANYQYKVDFDVPNGKYRMQSGSRAYNTPDSTGWSTVPSYDWAALSGGVTMMSGAACTSAAAVNVQFNADGTAKLESAGSPVAPAVTVCIAGGGNTAKTITVSTSGRVTLD